MEYWRDGSGVNECKDAPEVIWSGDELDWVKPRGCREYLRGVGKRYLTSPYFEEGWRKLLENYTPPKKYKLGLILPCSYGKPYSQSYIHYNIRRAIMEYLVKGELHEIIVTNAGVVPRELDEYWPYTAYDWNPKYENNLIKKCYTKVLSERLIGYLRKNMGYYKEIAAFLRWDSDSWKAVEIASKALNFRVDNLAPASVDREEVEDVSLNGLYKDEDLVLITPSALRLLKEGIKQKFR
jgi:hypothetical protein